MNLLGRLQEWCGRHSASVEDGLAYTFTTGLQGGSARIDVEGPSALGRLTVWASGLCDIEVIDAEAGEQVLYRHLELTSDAELYRFIDEMVRACQGPRPPG